MMITNHVDKFKPEEAVKRFNKRYTAPAIISLFLIFSSFNMTLYLMSGAESPVLPVARIITVSKTEAYYTQVATNLMMKPNRTVEENMFLGSLPKKAEELTTEFENAVASNDKIWTYALAGSMTSLFLSIFPCIFLMVYHKNIFVRSRGLPFTIHLTIASLGFYIVALVQTANFLLQFNKDFSKTEKEVKVQENIVYIFGSLFLNSVFWAIIGRMRIIYHAFNKKHNNGVSHWNYWKPAPIWFLLFLIPVFPSFLKIAHVFHGPASVIYQLPSCAIYVAWVYYYTYKCKNISDRFSDFYINFIIISVSMITITILMVCTYRDRYNTYVALGFMYPFNVIILVYLYYPVLPILYLMYKNKHFKPNQNKPENIFTSSSNLNPTASSSKITDPPSSENIYEKQDDSVIVSSDTFENQKSVEV